LSDAEYAELFDIVVDEVIDDYSSGKLEEQDRVRAESYFFRAASRREKARFASALRKRVAEHSSQRQEYASKTFRRRSFRPYLAIAASLILVALAAGIWWRYFNRSSLDQSLTDLNTAYRVQRPIESRISGLGYAPFLTTRGTERPRVDETALQRAELTLLTALKDRPTADVHHMLGEVYLAQRRFDEAIKQFEEALPGLPNNARLYSDLGAAWLEKGKLDLGGANATTPDSVTGKGLEELGKSLEYLNKAFELDSNLLEAVFNRALCQQYLMSGSAENDWREYIKRDPASPWTEEAKHYLNLIEERRGRSSRESKDVISDFRQARLSQDDDTAWRLISAEYTSAGNDLANRLLDAYLETGEPQKRNDRDIILADLSYLAKLQHTRSGDRYGLDLVTRYERMQPNVRPYVLDARRHAKLGYQLFTQSKFTEAIDEYRAAKLGFERAADKVEITFVEYRLAHSFIFLPDLERARFAFRQLQSICEKNDYRWLLAQCLYGLAHVSIDTSQYSQAMDYSAHALQTFDQLGDTNGVLKSLTQLADVNQALNRSLKSLTYLNQALAISVNTQSEPMQRWGVLVQLGFSMTARNLPAAALLYHFEALQVALQMGRPLILSRSYGYLGKAYAGMKRYSEAVAEASRAYETGKRIGEQPGGLEIMANASQQLGDIHRQSGECDKAVKYYDHSIDLYNRLGLNYYNYAAHKGKLLCSIAGAGDRGTDEELKTVLALSEDYRSKITTESQRNSFFDMEQTVYDVAINYEFTSKKDAVTAFAFSEKSRARSLLEALRRGCEVVKKGNGPELALTNVSSPMSLPEVQKMMPDRAQILQYSVLDDRLLMWIVTKSDIHYEEVPIGAESLAQKVRAYLAELNRSATSQDDDAVKQSEELYEILVSRVERFLDKSKFLCVVPDKILHYLPFDALRLTSGSRYLVEEYEIGIAPSSTIFCYLTKLAQRKSGVAHETMLIVGNPAFDHSRFDSLEDLPAAADEAQTIAALYPSQRVLLRSDAKESIVKSEFERASVVHLAMHYVLNENSAMLSGFPLTPEVSRTARSGDSNGFLQSYEIYSMKLPRTRLVILSACQTGIEQEFRGEGVVSIARPFLVAGVPSVIATLWPVDSVASAELMATFHRHRVHDRLPVHQALRQAQIDMVHAQDARHRHPYYWAPFVALGGLATY
jgi:CHAT domain-containing protein